MKNWPTPKLCIDCRWSKPEHGFAWNNECWHPAVIMRDSYALANNREGQPRGSSCSNQRQKLFGRCGRKGRLFERRLKSAESSQTSTNK